MMILVVLLAYLSPSFVFVGARKLKFDTFKMPTEDPYDVLGIRKTDQNNLDAIKKAYREKAKAAHPDKNPDLDPTVANERFHRIQDAWEFLSNNDHKKRYDNRHRNSGRRNSTFNFNSKPARKPRGQTSEEYARQRAEQKKRQDEQRRQQNENLKRRREEEQRQKEQEARLQRDFLELVKEAQDGLLKISTLEQLFEANIVDKATYRFQKNFLCVFVSNKSTERTAEKNFMFPYPFGSKGRNDIDWTSLIQTAKVRFNKATSLTQAFRVPMNVKRPYIVFARKGARFSSNDFHVFPDFKTAKIYKKLEDWVLKQLNTKVTIVNRHREGGPTIKIYYDQADNGTSGMLKSAGSFVPPGYQLEVPAKLSDRLIILDATTNEFIGSEGIYNQNELKLGETIAEKVAMDNVVVTEELQTIEIGTGYGTTRACYDLSTECHDWVTKGQRDHCQNLPNFAHSVCANSCGVCIDSPTFNGIYYMMLHTPAHKLPRGLQGAFVAWKKVAKFLETVGHDMHHIWSIRRTVTVSIVVSGLLSGIQVVLLVRMLLVMLGRSTSHSGQHERIATAYSPSLLKIGFLVVLTASIASGLFWLYHAPEHEVPRELMGFRYDLLIMQKTSADFVLTLFGLGFGSFVACEALMSMLFDSAHRRPWHYGAFLVMMAWVSTLVVLGFTIYLEKTEAGGLQQRYRLNRWKSIWKVRKNVAITLLGSGLLFAATVIAIAQRFVKRVWWSIRKRLPIKYVLASLVNLGVGCGLLALALTDPYFLEDLEHISSMRMSAAIPCLFIGVLLGLTGAHNFFGVPKAAETRRIQQEPHYPQETKDKIE
jgi:curved DNA-binding protein CbpA